MAKQYHSRATAYVNFRMRVGEDRYAELEGLAREEFRSQQRAYETKLAEWSLLEDKPRAPKQPSWVRIRYKVYTEGGMLSDSEEAVLRSEADDQRGVLNRMLGAAAEGREAEWREAVGRLPGGQKPSVEDFTWVYHELPLYAQSELQVNDRGMVCLPASAIKDAPSRGAAWLLLSALGDAAEFRKSVADIVKKESAKEKEKPEEDKDGVVDDDCGLDGLYAMMKK